MSTIKQAIQDEEIANLNTLLTQVQCTQDNSQYIFLAMTHLKPKATKAIFQHCQFSFTNSTNEHGDNPLKTAIYTYKNAEANQKEVALFIVNLTINHSDNLNIKDQYHNTPLMSAAYENMPHVVASLLQHNANYTITDNTGNNALDKALWAEHQDVVLEFFNHNASLKDAAILFRGQTPLTKMIYGNKTSMVRFLLQQNVSINAMTKDENNPKEIAAQLENQEIIGLLDNHNSDDL